MYNFDHITCSADIGRIRVEERKLELVICCPKIVWNGKPQTRNNTALETCIIRIEEKARCTKTCPIADKIKIAIAKGYEL
jgi:hypothetical protein